jgi:hypothetical protein
MYKTTTTFTKHSNKGNRKMFISKLDLRKNLKAGKRMEGYLLYPTGAGIVLLAHRTGKRPFFSSLAAG